MIMYTLVLHGGQQCQSFLQIKSPTFKALYFLDSLKMIVEFLFVTQSEDNADNYITLMEEIFAWNSISRVLLRI